MLNVYISNVNKYIDLEIKNTKVLAPKTKNIYIHHIFLFTCFVRIHHKIPINRKPSVKAVTREVLDSNPIGPVTLFIGIFLSFFRPCVNTGKVLRKTPPLTYGAHNLSFGPSVENRS